MFFGMMSLIACTIDEWFAVVDSDGYGEDVSGIVIIHVMSSMDVMLSIEPTFELKVWLCLVINCCLMCLVIYIVSN